MSEADLDPFQVPDVVEHTKYPPCPITYPLLMNLVAPAIQLPLPFHITAEPLSNASCLTNLTKEQRCARV